MPAAPGLEIEDLSFAYGSNVALDGVTARIAPGQFTALLGPNGAGKSTLVALLSCLFAVRPGQIRILGHDLGREPRRALALTGIVFQSPTLDLDLTVRQNMHYFAALHGLAGREAARRIETCLDWLGLTGREAEKARALNGGHRRRLEIARALVHRPRFLLLDEPTSGLDLPSRDALVRRVHELCQTEGLTVLWATHLVDEVWPGDEVIVLDGGRVRDAGPIGDVMARNGAHSVREAFERLTGPRGGAPRAPDGNG